MLIVPLAHKLCRAQYPLFGKIFHFKLSNLELFTRPSTHIQLNALKMVTQSAERHIPKEKNLSQFAETHKIMANPGYHLKC